MKAKCKKCGDTVEVTKPREFKSCKCGAINLDYGDGENYYRVGGNPEDFDGEIEGVPKIKDPIRPSEMCNLDESMEKAMDIIGEENIGGESKPVGKADKPVEHREYLNKAAKVKESFRNVNVDLCEDGTLWINDAKTDEQLAQFIIRQYLGVV